jgi:site-specific recombinase XerD
MQEFAGIEHHKRKKRHALRHTITSMLSDNGASLQELMAFNGWSDERSALGYTETGQDKLAKLINKIN